MALTPLDVVSSCGQGSMNPNPHSERKHSKISPSKLGVLEVSPRFEADPNQEVHPVTASGTRCHEAKEKPGSVKLSEEEAELVVRADQIEDRYSKSFPITYSEVRLEVLDGIWGFADVVRLDRQNKPTRAVILDWKFGFNKQEAVEDNAAAQAYALGVFERWPTLEAIEVCYYYPRLSDLDQHTYTRQDISRIRTRIAAIVARVKAARPENPGDCSITENCVYCKNLADCSTVNHSALPLAKRYAERKEFDLPAELDPALVSDPRQMGTLLNLAIVMEKWVESVRMHAKQMRVESGIEIEGWTVTEQQGKLSVLDVNSAYSRFLARGGTHTEFMSACSVSVPEISETLGNAAPKGQKAQVVKQFRSELLDSGVASLGSPFLVLRREKKK